MLLRFNRICVKVIRGNVPKAVFYWHEDVLPKFWLVTDDSLRSDVLLRPGVVVLAFYNSHMWTFCFQGRELKVSCISFWIKVYRRRDTVIVGTHEEYLTVFRPGTQQSNARKTEHVVVDTKPGRWLKMAAHENFVSSVCIKPPQHRALAEA